MLAINLDDAGYDEVEANENGKFTPLVPGNYVCKILNAAITNLNPRESEQLVLAVDIVEGEFTNYFRKAYEHYKAKGDNAVWSWRAIFKRYIFAGGGGGKKITPSFKSLLTCIEKSNPKFKLERKNFRSESLKNLFCGFSFEETETNNGKTVVKVQFPMTIDKAREKISKPPKSADSQKENKADTKSGEPFDSGGDDIFDGTPLDEDNLPF